MTEKQDWRPNWRNEAEYPDPEKTTLGKWAWEFLRRNKNYHADYLDLTSELQKIGFTEVDKTGIRNAAEREIFTKGCMLCDEMIVTKYRVKNSINRPANPVLSYESEQPYFLGIPTLTFHNCFYQKNPNSQFYHSRSHHYQEGMELSENLLNKEACIENVRISSSMRAHPRSLTVELSLERSLPEQIAILQKVATQQQKKLKGWGLLVKGRDKSDHWCGYLQLLDALENGASFGEIHGELFPGLSNSDPDYYAHKQYYNWKNVAEKLASSGYLKISALQLSLK